MPSTRRGLLAGIGCVLASTTAGCVSNLRSRLSGPFEGTVSDVSKYYPAENSTIQKLDAMSINPENYSTKTQSLADLSPKVHREALLAITRENYYGTKENQLHIDDHYVIQYGSEFFSLSTSVGGGESAVEYEDIFSLDATIEETELTLTVTNEAAESTTGLTWGPPPFGILFAWDGQPHFLQHEQYSQNDSIVTENGKIYPWYDGNDVRGESRTEIAAGSSIEATYTVPNGITKEARIFLDMSYNIPDNSNVVWEVTLTD
jgi:hypothetical protein